MQHNYFFRVFSYMDWIKTNIADGACGGSKPGTTTKKPTTTTADYYYWYYVSNFHVIKVVMK